LSEQVLEEKKKRILISPGRFILPSRPETEQRRFVGPLGIWPWPIVNLLLTIIENMSVRRYTPSYYFPRTATRRIEYIRDSQGRIIEKYEEVTIE